MNTKLSAPTVLVRGFDEEWLVVTMPLREDVFRRSACVQNVCAKILRIPSNPLNLIYYYNWRRRRDTATKDVTVTAKLGYAVKVVVDGVNLRSKNPMWWEVVCIQSVYIKRVYKRFISY
jgi:hypothetical protein